MKVNVPWTDTKVTSTASNTTKAYLVGSTSASTDTSTLIKDTGVYLDTVAGKLVATTFEGSLYGTATKATQDSEGQQINTTYIKGLSVSGKVITYTRGDDTTGTITTQDTTYPEMTGATASANGTKGLVPAPSSGKQNYFLRGDGTWAFLEGTTYTIATGDNNGQIKVTPSSGGAYNVTVKGLNTAAYRGVDTTPTSGSTNLITSGGVYDLIGIVGDIDAILDRINGEVV